MRIHDAMANHILAKLDVVDMVRMYHPEYEPDGSVKCPRHDDKNASLHISMEGKAYCHGCGWKASNIIDLHAKYSGITYAESRKQLYYQVVNAIPEGRFERYHDMLMNDVHHPAWAWLKHRRISRQAVLSYKIGYDPDRDRITIPILDQFSTCVNIREAAYNPNRESRCKMTNLKGHGDVRLYPEWLAVNEHKLLLVEGEWDCLTGRELGLPAVTWTGGASAWSDEYAWLLKDKDIMVLYDADQAGREGAARVAEKIRKLGSRVNVLVPKSFSSGKDLNDWYRMKSSLVDKIVAAFNAWTPQVMDVKCVDGVCPCCGRAYE